MTSLLLEEKTSTLEKGLFLLMHILTENVFWMIFNSYLAALPVLFSWLFFKTHSKYLKIAFALLWFVYLPNTLYLFTDLLHVPKQWMQLGDSDRVILIFQYITLELIGFVTFLLAFSAFEKFLFMVTGKKEKKLNYAILITVNLLVGFGIVLGRVERINSWEIFTAPGKVLDSVLYVFSSIELIGLAILFGLFANFFYFLFKDPFIKLTKRIDK